MKRNKNDITELGQVSSHESYRCGHVGENPACRTKNHRDKPVIRGCVADRFP